MRQRCPEEASSRRERDHLGRLVSMVAAALIVGAVLGIAVLFRLAAN